MLTAGIFLAVTVAALVLLQFGGAGGRDRGLVRRRLAQEFAAAHGPAAGHLYKDLGSLDLDSWGDKPPTTDATPAARPKAPPPPSVWWPSAAGCCPTDCPPTAGGCCPGCGR